MPWPSCPNRNVFSDRRNSLYDMSASFRYDGRLFHSLGPAALDALSPKVLYVCVTAHVRLADLRQVPTMLTACLPACQLLPGWTPIWRTWKKLRICHWSWKSQGNCGLPVVCYRSCIGSAPFRLIQICLMWTKLLLTDVLNASWRNPDPNPNPKTNPNPNPNPSHNHNPNPESNHNPNPNPNPNPKPNPRIRRNGKTPLH